jgi:hypothetical protein
MMNTLFNILVFGVTGSIAIFVVVVFMLWINPWLFLPDYPIHIRRVSPITPVEKRLNVFWRSALLLQIISFPLAAALSLKAAHQDFLAIFLSAFGTACFVTTFDWLIINWLILSNSIPKFLAIRSGNMTDGKNHRMHFKSFLLGTILSVLISIIIAAIVVYI